MKKKVVRKKSSSRKPVMVNNKFGTNTLKVFYTKYYVIGIATVAAGSLFLGIHTGDRPLVLGTSILADKGADDGAAERPIQGMKPPIPPNSEPRPSGTAIQGRAAFAANTYVDCVGPDGVHFQSNLQKCYEVNKAANNLNFKYTVIKSPITTPNVERLGPRPSGAPDFIRDRSASESSSDRNQRGKDARAHVEKTGEKNFSLKENGVKAQSRMPLSIDSSTHKVMMTTSTGEKEVSVRLNEVVERLKQTGKISNVQNEASGAANREADSSQTELTELNNAPVIKVKGFSNKKVLGLFPASFAKTIFVSATDGSVVKTDQTFFSKLFETISF